MYVMRVHPKILMSTTVRPENPPVFDIVSWLSTGLRSKEYFTICTIGYEHIGIV